MMQHRNRSGVEVSMHHSNNSYEAFTYALKRMVVVSNWLRKW